jgi:hypothetical protein
MNYNLISKIAKYGDVYVEKNLSEYLSEDSKNLLVNDSFKALTFLFGRIYYQGRKDSLSKDVSIAATNVLLRFTEQNNGDKESIFDKYNLSEIENELNKDIGSKEGEGNHHRVGRSRDVKMTKKVLEMISDIENHNIVKYSLARINSGHLIDHYNELQKIHSIGPKISSFYLRDLICLYDLDSKIPLEQIKVIQPIDTWVKQVAQAVAIIPITDKESIDKVSTDTYKTKIFDACQEANVSVIKFNQGAWYLGANSFKVLISNLNNLQFENDV